MTLKNRNESFFHGLWRSYIQNIDAMKALELEDKSVIGNYVPPDDSPRCPKCNSYRYVVCPHNTCNYRVCVDCDYSPNPAKAGNEHPGQKQ